MSMKVTEKWSGPAWMIVGLILFGFMMGCTKHVCPPTFEDLYLECEESINAYDAMGDRLEDAVTRSKRGQADADRALEQCEGRFNREQVKSTR